MNNQRKKDAILHRLRRNMGMSEEVRERIRKQNEGFDDWYGTCRRCRATLYGTPKQLKEGCSCGKEG